MPTATAVSPARHSGLSIEKILGPLSLPEFLDKHWEKEHLLLKRNDPGHYGSIFCFEDIDRYLTVAAKNSNTWMSLGSTGEDGRISMRKMRVQEMRLKEIFKAFHSGGTIMLDSIDQCWPAAAELAAVMGDALSASVKVNAYITPPGFQGAPIHPDIQDVFALQMEGAKEWYVYDDRCYEPVENLQLMDFIGKQRHAYPDDIQVKLQATLETGDLLYIPRGLVHKAVAPQDSPSIHLAVCVTPFYWVDFLKAAVEVGSVTHQGLAAGLPVGFERSDEARTDMRSRFKEAVEALVADEELFDRTLQVMRQARVASTAQAGDGHLKQIVDLESIELHSEVVKRPGHPCTYRADDKGAVLIFGPGGQMGGPPALKEAFDFICENAAFQVADLPGPISDGSKVTVVKRLIRDGLLRTVGA